MRLVKTLASLRLTLGLFIALGCGILVAHFGGFRFSPIVAACLAGLACNLLAMIVSNARFRRQLPLLVFHAALLVIILLVALGRMVYLKGQAEVLEGQAFDGRLVKVDAGAWHPWQLDKAAFVNHGFRVHYAPGLRRMQTENRVSWTDEHGRHAEAIIGDDKPLILNGYRFYTTWNKGFSLVFRWQPERGPVAIGAVNLPGYPANALKQAQEWHLPHLSAPVWAMLQFDETLIPDDQDAEFRLPADFRVVVRHQEHRWEIDPHHPETIKLPGGSLQFLGLTTWMGYLVAWDGTMPWLLLASAIAAVALSLHFWNHFSRHPWNPGSEAAAPPESGNTNGVLVGSTERT